MVPPFHLERDEEEVELRHLQETKPPVEEVVEPEVGRVLLAGPLDQVGGVAAAQQKDALPEKFGRRLREHPAVHRAVVLPLLRGVEWVRQEVPPRPVAFRLCRQVGRVAEHKDPPHQELPDPEQVLRPHLKDREHVPEQRRLVQHRPVVV